MATIEDRLLALRDADYRRFLLGLIPTVPPETVIGVRTPQLRRLARELRQESDAFLAALPHRYYEENNLHGFLICEIRDVSACVEALDRFLPYVDNWATCDSISPKVFAKHPELLRGEIERWLRSGEVYTVRFAIRMLMNHFLGARFEPEVLATVAALRSDEYYVNMMIAWFFATALALQYEAALPFLSTGQLAPWVHNKAIQKARESLRIPPDRKEALRALKIR